MFWVWICGFLSACKTPADPPMLKLELAEILVANVETLRSLLLLNLVNVLDADELVTEGGGGWRQLALVVAEDRMV